MLERLQEVYRYRELLRNLILRELKVRYRNSVLGFFWTWGNPILMMLVFTTLFTVLQRTEVTRFPLFILIGWLAWSFTLSSISEGLSSVVGSSNLIRKAYFPHEVLPASVVLANGANFIFTLPLILGLMFVSKVNLDLPLMIYLPLLFVCQTALAMGVVFFLSAVNVLYRDTAVITSVALTAWFFLTPVFYPVQYINGLWNGIDVRRTWYILNPMASIIEGYRNIFYGSPTDGPPGPPDIYFLARTFVTSVAILMLGYLFFLRLSRRFGEEL